MITRNGNSVIGLVRELKREAQEFIGREIQLVKAEMTAKVSHYTKNGVSLAIGGALAYAGLIIFLGALAAAAAYGFRQAGLAPLLAAAAGLGAIGLIVIATGAMLVLKGVKALKQESPAPERTIGTLQLLKGTPVPGPEERAARKAAERKSGDHPTPEQAEARVVETELKMADTLEELADRVSFTRVRGLATTQVREHPYRWGLVAAGFGAAGSFLLKRRLGKARA